jgi:hypothetical protein
MDEKPLNAIKSFVEDMAETFDDEQITNFKTFVSMLDVEKHQSVIEKLYSSFSSFFEINPVLKNEMKVEGNIQINEKIGLSIKKCFSLCFPRNQDCVYNIVAHLGYIRYLLNPTDENKEQMEKLKKEAEEYEPSPEDEMIDTMIEKTSSLMKNVKQGGNMDITGIIGNLMGQGGIGDMTKLFSENSKKLNKKKIIGKMNYMLTNLFEQLIDDDESSEEQSDDEKVKEIEN